jgi:hypothetical protein
MPSATYVVSVLAIVGLVILLIELVLYLVQQRRDGIKKSKNRPLHPIPLRFYRRPILMTSGFFVLVLAGAGTIVANIATSSENVQLSHNTCMLETAYYRLTMANKLRSYFSICPQFKRTLDSLQPQIDSVRVLAFADTASMQSYHLFTCRINRSGTLMAVPSVSKAGSANSSEVFSAFLRKKNNDGWGQWQTISPIRKQIPYVGNCNSKFDTLRNWVETIMFPAVDAPSDYQLAIGLKSRGWAPGNPPSILLEDFSGINPSPSLELVLCLDKRANVCEELSFSPHLGDSLESFDGLVKVLMNPNELSRVVAESLVLTESSSMSDNWNFIDSARLTELYLQYKFRYSFKVRDTHKVVGVAFHYPTLGYWEGNSLYCRTGSPSDAAYK